jgi:hypothetical protein
MKNKKMISTMICLILGLSTYSQTIESEGYLIIQMIQPSGSKTVVNIVSPNGTSEQIELEKIPAMSMSVENIKKIVSSNQAKLLSILEIYRKKDYEIVSVTSEFTGLVTNYLLLKK